MAKATKSKVVMIRMSEGMYKQVLDQANKKHMSTVQEYIRYLLTRELDRVSSYFEES